MKCNDLEIARLCRSISLLLHGGIFLSDGIFLLAHEETGEMRELLRSMGEAMDQGASLSQAMAQTGSFPEHVAAMTAVGEKTGRVEKALESISLFYEERARTARQIRTALTYPAILLVLMLGVIGVLLVRVLPVFDRVYVSLGSRLTGAAAGLLALGQGLERCLPALLALAAAVGIGMLAYRKIPAFQARVQSVFQAWLGDRGFLKKFNNARCARALAMGLHSGLPLEESLDLARELLADAPRAARRCESCAAALEAGESLSQAMSEAELLPQAQSQILTVGLRSGSADQVMEAIAGALTEEAQASLEETVAKVEPAMVIACALLVGAILLAVMLPLMGILTAIG